MRAVIIGLLIVCSGTLAAQTVPPVILDSLIFEVKLGRACTQVTNAQAEEIKALGAELMQTNKALKLSMNESLTLQSLVDNSRQSNDILTKQFALDRKEMKRKLKRRTVIVIGETILILLLI